MRPKFCSLQKGTWNLSKIYLKLTFESYKNCERIVPERETVSLSLNFPQLVRRIPLKKQSRRLKLASNLTFV